MQSECSVDEGSIEVLQEGRNAVRVEVADRVLFVTVTVIPDEHCAGLDKDANCQHRDSHVARVLAIFDIALTLMTRSHCNPPPSCWWF